MKKTGLKYNQCVKRNHKIYRLRGINAQIKALKDTTILPEESKITQYDLNHELTKASYCFDVIISILNKQLKKA